MASRSVPLLFSNRTDVGRVREVNEDYLGYFRNPRQHLFAVADGMGGEVGGREASHSAVAAVQDVFERSADELDPPELLAEAVAAANRACLRRQAEQPELDGMGTTLELVLVDGDRVWWSHIGDSRIYKVFGGRHEQLTSDHTVVNRLLRQGMISEEEAQDHPQRHVLSRVIGREENYQPDVSPVPVPLVVGEALVICSDGLSDVVTGDEIAWVVSRLGPQKACERLVQLANERGGHDNITVQVIFRGRARKAWKRLSTAVSIERIARSPLKALWPWAAVLVALAGLLALAFWLLRKPSETLGEGPDRPVAEATAPAPAAPTAADPAEGEPPVPEAATAASSPTFTRLKLANFATDEDLDAWATVSLEDGEVGGSRRPPASPDTDSGHLLIPMRALSEPQIDPVLRARWRPSETGPRVAIVQSYSGLGLVQRVEILGISSGALANEGAERGRALWRVAIGDGESHVRAAGEPSHTTCDPRAEEPLELLPKSDGAVSVALSPEAGAAFLAPGPMLCKFRLPDTEAADTVEVSIFLENYQAPDDDSETDLRMHSLWHRSFEDDAVEQAVGALRERLQR